MAAWLHVPSWRPCDFLLALVPVMLMQVRTKILLCMQAHHCSDPDSCCQPTDPGRPLCRLGLTIVALCPVHTSISSAARVVWSLGDVQTSS
jgi:hypothetical protein